MFEFNHWIVKKNEKKKEANQGSKYTQLSWIESLIRGG